MHQKSTLETIRVLTQADVLFYRENGFLVVADLFSNQECDRILAYMETLTDANFQAVLNPDRQLPQAREVMRDPRCVGIMETLQGAEVVGLMSQILFKKAGSPYASQAWNPHQDNAYPQAEPGAYITVNIFLADSDPENGGMYVYPGSHREPLLEFVPTPSYREKIGTNPGNTVAVPEKYERLDLVIKKGGMLVLHGHLIHGSHPNLSQNRSRPLFSISYLTKGKEFLRGKNANRMEIPLR